MRKLIIAAFIIIPIIIILSLKVYGLDEVGEELKLYMGEIKVLSVNTPNRVVIGNPEIADVTNVTKNEITLVSKSLGSTTLVIWDIFGEQSYRVRVFAEDTGELKRRIDNLLGTLNLPGVSTRAEDEEGKVIILGKVKTPQDRERISTVLGNLKDKTVDLLEIKEEEAVIDIDVQVLELNKDATTTLGFTWPGSVTLTDSSGPTSTAVTGLKKIFHVSDFTRTAFNLSLDALVQEGKARILSRPRLACQSGKEAELLVGGEKPTMTTDVVTGGGTDTNVEYKEYGIKLKIKPTVYEENRIKIALNVEVSEVGTAEVLGSASAPTARAYPLTKRNASTELFLNDGQTLGIGGLIKQKAEEDIRKTPWLADVPVLGALFRKKTTTTGGGQGERGNVELFITLTPSIIKSRDVSSETASLKKKTEPVEIARQTADIAPEFASYAKAVQLKITRALYYPPQAKEAGWGGNVKLNLDLNSNGSLKDIKILESSGYKILDDAALEVAKNQAPYPPFPPQIESEEIWIVVPVVYKTD